MRRMVHYQRQRWSGYQFLSHPWAGGGEGLQLLYPCL